jgi:hypothetical protein
METVSRLCEPLDVLVLHARNQYLRTFFMRYILLLALLFQSFISKAGDNSGAADDSLPEGKNSRFLLFPFILKSPETSWGFGTAGAFFFKAKKNEPDVRTSDISLISLYTLRKQLVVVLSSTVYFKGEEEILRTQISNSFYPDRFWGIGNDTRYEDMEEYSIHQYFINPQLLIRIKHKFYIGANVEFQRVYDFSYVSGGLFDQQNITGRAGGSIPGVGLLFTWDARNNAYSPDKGFFAELNSSRYSEKIGGSFDFWAHTIDLRKFFTLRKNTVFAAQSVLRMTSGDVPVRNLSMIGGSELMRGYWKGRFADKNMFALQADLRQFLFWRIGIVGFAGVAQVSDKLAHFGLNEFHLAGGAGLRLMLQKKEKLNLRIDYGIGEHSTGLYVILKEAF